MADPTLISWDWKSRPSHEDLTRALTPFGIRVYADPSCEGTDSFGYVFADRDLTPEEVAAVSSEDPTDD